MFNEKKTLLYLLSRLWKHVSLPRRGQFLMLTGLMLITSFSEILSIGAVMPFIGALTMPDKIFGHYLVQPIVHSLNITSPQQLLLPITLMFTAAVLLAGAMRLALLFSSVKLSYVTGADISMSVYRRTLYQPYYVHCGRNSSEVINGITSKTDVTINIISMVITFASSIFLLLGILIGLFLLDPMVAMSAFGGFCVIYFLIIRLTRSQLMINSKVNAYESTQVIKSLQEGLGGIRDVLIDGSQETYCEIYRNADLPLRRVKASNLFISGSPRFITEALGMTLIAMLAYYLTIQSDGLNKAIPILGALALGAQRLLPLFQQAYAALTYITSSQDSLRDALELLEQPMPINFNQAVMPPMVFNKNICLSQIEFRYNFHDALVLKNINLTIQKGDRVGFIGPTGSGKSTLLDIIMGLLQPTSGLIQIDDQVLTLANNRAWQAHIAHVPQAIFLADSSILENIAFGVPRDKIDYDRVILAAQKAKISESIECWPNKYQTLVGERGVRLSGGQRQRIGIARALYKQADVIIFDEATSALDGDTENSVMHSIEGLGKDLTLLIIAHRITTLKNCTHIVELGNAGIKHIGKYKDIVNITK